MGLNSEATPLPEQQLQENVIVPAVTMLAEYECKAKANQMEARRRLMDEGIAVLRQSFDPKKLLKGSVSAVQANGVYVSIIAGKDAFVPIAEMPKRFTSKDEDSEGKAKPSLEAGRMVEFRVIRYTWQTDSFLASMLSYEESVARSNSARADRGARSAPAAINVAYANDAAGSSHERLDTQPPLELSNTAKKLTEKGFSVVDSSTASDLNAWLAESTAAQKNKASNSKVLVKNEKAFIVNIVRGMAGKVVGQLTLPTRFGEKEIKEAAIELVSKSGEIKAGQDHKGVTIAKNIITVKL